ncbi:hypothetical protein DPMN_154972 [Dreissena polymorpha]|uniref:Uncharacterized protein n=1 Tax=Dreissena polymorpha TaxID=45954 RepID=A0A9D4FLH6_DREPO|nr:hypothetical protein DPMN_154972 [Dreissena polymorpha]
MTQTSAQWNQGQRSTSQSRSRPNQVAEVQPNARTHIGQSIQHSQSGRNIQLIRGNPIRNLNVQSNVRLHQGSNQGGQTQRITNRSPNPNRQSRAMQRPSPNQGRTGTGSSSSRIRNFPSQQFTRQSQNVQRTVQHQQEASRSRGLNQILQTVASEQRRNPASGAIPEKTLTLAQNTTDHFYNTLINEFVRELENRVVASNANTHQQGIQSFSTTGQVHLSPQNVLPIAHHVLPQHIGGLVPVGFSPFGFSPLYMGSFYPQDPDNIDYPDPVQIPDPVKPTDAPVVNAKTTTSGITEPTTIDPIVLTTQSPEFTSPTPLDVTYSTVVIDTTVNTSTIISNSSTPSDLKHVEITTTVSVKPAADLVNNSTKRPDIATVNKDVAATVAKPEQLHGANGTLSNPQESRNITTGIANTTLIHVTTALPAKGQSKKGNHSSV